MKYEDLTPEQQAEHDASVASSIAEQAAREAEAAARKAERDAALAETPADVNSVPALRDKLNEVLAILRGDAP